MSLHEFVYRNQNHLHIIVCLTTIFLRQVPIVLQAHHSIWQLCFSLWIICVKTCNSDFVQLFRVVTQSLTSGSFYQFEFKSLNLQVCVNYLPFCLKWLVGTCKNNRRFHKRTRCVLYNDSKKKKKQLVFTCNYDDSNCTFNLYIIIHCLPNCYSMIYYLPRSPLLVNGYNSQYCHQTQQCEQCCSYCHCNPN